ncbi:MAG: hypothetical protein HY682_04675 [Chloroflexi bacterium]|nr:hypothetical protein [Chloroflexota bacterium]
MNKAPERTSQCFLCERQFRSDWAVACHVAGMNGWADRHGAWIRQNFPSVPRSRRGWGLAREIQDKVGEELLAFARTQRKGSRLNAKSLRAVQDDIGELKDLVSRQGIRRLRERVEDEQRHQEVLRRLPPDADTVRRTLADRIGPAWDLLPSSVVDSLAQAELYYWTDIHTNSAIVEFARSIEALLRHFLKAVLPETSPGRGLSLNQYARRIRDTLDGGHKQDSALKEFLGAKGLLGRHEELIDWCKLLDYIHELRSGAAHFEDTGSIYEREGSRLRQMRMIVIGDPPETESLVAFTVDLLR